MHTLAIIIMKTIEYHSISSLYEGFIKALDELIVSDSERCEEQQSQHYYQSQNVLEHVQDIVDCDPSPYYADDGYSPPREWFPEAES